MFWKKQEKKLNSNEYEKLYRMISLLQIDVDSLLIRKKRNIKPKEEEDDKEKDKNPIILPM